MRCVTDRRTTFWDAALIDALVAMATDGTHGWWEEYRGRLPTPFMDLPELEHHASYR